MPTNRVARPRKKGITDQQHRGRRWAPCCTAKKAGGTRRQLDLCCPLQLVLCRYEGWTKPPHQTCCAVQSSGALCTLQSQLGATEPPSSALCCSQSTEASTPTSSGFQIARAGQFGPGAFITNLFSFFQSPATKETRHTDS